MQVKVLSKLAGRIAKSQRSKKHLRLLSAIPTSLVFRVRWMSLATIPYSEKNWIQEGIVGPVVVD